MENHDKVLNTSKGGGHMDISTLPQELVQTYPKAQRAILLVEDDIDSTWWKSLKEYTTKFGVDIGIQAMSGMCTNTSEPFIKLAREEFLTDDFRRYFMGKLGMM